MFRDFAFKEEHKAVDVALRNIILVSAVVSDVLELLKKLL